MSFALDTLSISKRLQKAGAEKKLAEEYAAIMAETLTDTIASKSDILKVNSELRLVEQRMTIRLLLSQIAVVIATVTILGFILGQS